MQKITAEAKARNLSEDELIHQLETGQLDSSLVFPALKDQLAVEAHIAERAQRAAAAERAAAERAAREMIRLVYEIRSEPRQQPRHGFRVRLNHALVNAGAAAAHLMQALLPPTPVEREGLARLSPGTALRQGLSSPC